MNNISCFEFNRSVSIRCIWKVFGITLPSNRYILNDVCVQWNNRNLFRTFSVCLLIICLWWCCSSFCSAYMKRSAIISQEEMQEGSPNRANARAAKGAFLCIEFGLRARGANSPYFSHCIVAFYSSSRVTQCFPSIPFFRHFSASIPHSHARNVHCKWVDVPREIRKGSK